MFNIITKIYQQPTVNHLLQHNHYNILKFVQTPDHLL